MVDLHDVTQNVTSLHVWEVKPKLFSQMTKWCSYKLMTNGTESSRSSLMIVNIPQNKLALCPLTIASFHHHGHQDRTSLSNMQVFPHRFGVIWMGKHDVPISWIISIHSFQGKRTSHYYSDEPVVNTILIPSCSQYYFLKIIINSMSFYCYY